MENNVIRFEGPDIKVTLDRAVNNDWKRFLMELGWLSDALYKGRLHIQQEIEDCGEDNCRRESLEAQTRFLDAFGKNVGDNVEYVRRFITN